VAAGPPARTGRIRVVTWNIRAAIGPGEPFPPAWWRHVQPDRFERIGAVLTGLDADVVTLQEVTILNVDGGVVDQPAELARLTGRHVGYGAVHAFPLVEPETGRAIGSASWGNAILTPEPLAGGFTRGLPRAADDDLVEPPGSGHPLAGVRYGDVEPGHREPRCVVGGAARGITVATTHLTYIGREQRRRQVEALATVVDDADGPFVVAGDLNTSVEATEVALLSARLIDAFGEVGVAAGDDKRRSSGAVAIDHVFVRGLEVIDCRVAREAGDLSDHWPIVVDLRVR
jgi:endonuclease/exonuclease/phosphatase family metal-dependent hydrolase